jgi:hypothetical protein
MDESPSTCGHMACTGGKCNVRYVGPVSHIRDHHVVHAARHASHIWSAAIVAGLAVVLTGALGYAAIGAESSGSMYGEFQQINHRLDKIEGMVKTLLDRCVLSSKCEEQAPAEDQCAEKCRQENGDNLEKTNACIRDMCQKPVEKPIADDSACRQTCESKYQMLDLTQEQIGEKVNACMAELCPAPVVDQCKADCQAKWGDNLDGTNQCITENCSAAPSAPLPTNMMDKTNPMEKPVTEEVSDACLDKCYNSRVMCFKEAGSNYTALRKCVSAEAQCKTACNKQ